MAFDFSCPVCGHTTEMDNSAVGEMGICPKCETEVNIQRGSEGVKNKQPLTSDDDQASPTSTGSPDNNDVKLSPATTIVNRIVVVAVFLSIMGGGGYMIYNGFSVFGFEYEGILGMLEDEPDNELSDHQKRLLEETKQGQGPPDYSHLAVELEPLTEEEIRINEAMGLDTGGLNGQLSGGGEEGSQGDQSSRRRSFDPEQIFTERDKDMDGLLTGDEISERMQSRADEMDEDGDGAISKEEFLSAMERFRASRQNGGGEGGTAPNDSDSTESQ